MDRCSGTTLLLTLAVFLPCVMVTNTQDADGMIAFPSGVRFQPVDPDDARTSKDAFLFDASGIENKKLSLSFKVSAFKHTSQDEFRADPVLFRCIQKTQNAMQSAGERVEIVSGYVPPAQATGAHHDVYQSTGAAARIRLKAGGSLTLEDLTKAAVKNCVPLFQEINRDIGLALFTDQLQIHIQGPDEAAPYYFTGPGVTTDLENLALDCIDEAYDLSGIVMCPDDGTSPSVTSGQLFPSTVTTLEEAVGGIDTAITRSDEVDFGRLGQYPARLIEFEDTEGSGACANKLVGSSLSARCADRTMNYRLLRFLRSLGKATSEEWSGVKLKVKEAWDEGDQPAGSLHHEGRAAQVVTSDGDASKLTRLSALAICAGVDAVQHNGDHLVLAALKQKGTTARTVAFSDNQVMVECDVPDAKSHMYKLRDEFSDTEVHSYPLFDSADRHDFRLAQEVTLGMFVPRDGRYLRLSPLIVSCLQSIFLTEKKYKEEMPMKVCRSYYNSIEVNSEIDIFDKRYPSSGLGLSMELSPDCEWNQTAPMDLFNQTHTVVEQCAPIFYRANGKSMGIGVYKDFIHVDIRPTFKAWAANAELREGATEEEFMEYYQRWATRAIQGRIVDPDDLEEACLASTKPSRQDVNFVHTFPTKTFDDTDDNDPNKCVPKDDTAFCTSTQTHRDVEVERIWKEVSRKHLYHDESELKEALTKCIGTCGTCQEGPYWRIKVENCNNFLHWVPFGFLNSYNEDEPGDDVNLYLQESIDLKHYACAGHCLNKAPLFSLLVPTMEKLYRPNPAESIQERLYTVADNPSPVFELMHQLYAVSAKGIVKVWVDTEKELITLKDPLKYVFLYNKNVTKVEVYVAKSPNKDIVSGVLQTFISEWTKQGCLDYSRKFVPLYSVSDLPPHMSKRSVQFDLREQMLHRHRTWEDRWLNGHPLL